MQVRSPSEKWIWPAWFGLCGVLTAFAVVLIVFGDRFAWERPLQDTPALELAGGLFAAGLVYGLLYPLTHWTLRSKTSGLRGLLGIVLLAGLGLRLIVFPSMPALEDDFYRYLWDGAVTSAGHNPYAFAPASAPTNKAAPALQQLGQVGVLVLERVNHPELKTIYPPVTQAAFAIAHWIEPWSLRSWRLVCLLGECISAALILSLLSTVGRSPLWVALYWLNPLVVKELINSAHMEAIVLPFVLGALLLLVRQRPVWATVALGLAIGAKLWPMMLLPLVLRPLLGTPWRLAAALILLCVMALAWIVPPCFGGLGPDSGFVAYATRWQTNSALFQLLQYLASVLLGEFNLAGNTPGVVVRLITAGCVGAFATWLVRDHTTEPDVIVGRAAIVVLVLFLVSPAQFPWYASWVLIFAPLRPLIAHVGLTVLMPLYYASFYLLGINQYDSLNPWLIWLEWLPIWSLLLLDARLAWRRPLAVDLTMHNPERS